MTRQSAALTGDDRRRHRVGRPGRFLVGVLRHCLRYIATLGGWRSWRRTVAGGDVHGPGGPTGPADPHSPVRGSGPRCPPSLPRSGRSPLARVPPRAGRARPDATGRRRAHGHPPSTASIPRATSTPSPRVGCRRAASSTSMRPASSARDGREVGHSQPQRRQARRPAAGAEARDQPSHAGAGTPTHRERRRRPASWAVHHRARDGAAPRRAARPALGGCGPGCRSSPCAPHARQRQGRAHAARAQDRSQPAHGDARGRGGDGAPGPPDPAAHGAPRLRLPLGRQRPRVHHDARDAVSRGDDHPGVPGGAGARGAAPLPLPRPPHAAATFLLAQGFTLEDVKNLLGHSSIVLTSNT